jgi:hypothetical protein
VKNLIALALATCLVAGAAYAEEAPKETPAASAKPKAKAKKKAKKKKVVRSALEKALRKRIRRLKLEAEQKGAVEAAWAERRAREAELQAAVKKSARGRDPLTKARAVRDLRAHEVETLMAVPSTTVDKRSTSAPV